MSRSYRSRPRSWSQGQGHGSVTEYTHSRSVNYFDWKAILLKCNFWIRGHPAFTSFCCVQSAQPAADQSSREDRSAVAHLCRRCQPVSQSRCCRYVVSHQGAAALVAHSSICLPIFIFLRRFSLTGPERS